jgi:hypothetical protein
MIARVSGALVLSIAMLLSALTPMATLSAQTSVAPPAPATPIGDVETLRQRVAAFWAARVEGNPTAQWDLLEPRGKGRMTASEYAPGGGAVKYLAYQVEEAVVNGFFATVKVRVLAQPLMPVTESRKIAPAAVVVPDRWVRIGGVWYRSLEQEEQARGPQTGQR